MKIISWSRAIFLGRPFSVHSHSCEKKDYYKPLDLGEKTLEARKQ